MLNPKAAAMNEEVKKIAESQEVNLARQTFGDILFQDRRDILEKYKGDENAQAAYMIAWASVCMAEAMNCFRAGGAFMPLEMAKHNVKLEEAYLARTLAKYLSNGG